MTVMPALTADQMRLLRSLVPDGERALEMPGLPGPSVLSGDDAYTLVDLRALTSADLVMCAEVYGDENDPDMSAWVITPEGRAVAQAAE